MTSTFPRALQFVLKWEGGYVNDPDDPGGETKYGISKRAFPLLDIKNLTKDEAAAIYRDHYWRKAGCDELPTPLDIVHMDTAVNCGVGAAKAILTKTTDPVEYLFLRLQRYAGLGKPKYITGWLNRVIDLYKTIKEG